MILKTGLVEGSIIVFNSVVRCVKHDASVHVVLGLIESENSVGFTIF